MAKDPISSYADRHEAALAGYECALALRPDYPEAFNNRGVTLQALRRHLGALASFDAALALRPDFVEALVNRGIAHHELKQFGDALAGYEAVEAVVGRTRQVDVRLGVEDGDRSE